MNYRCPGGEIDVVAQQGDTLVFVEVKARSGTGWGHPAESVDLRKQRRIRRAALHWLARRGWPRVPVRFDVVALLVGGEVEVIQGAFEAPED